MSKTTPHPLIHQSEETDSERNGSSASDHIVLEIRNEKTQKREVTPHKNEKRKKDKLTLKDLQIIKTLIPYLWRGLGTKIRVIIALLCLVLAKVCHLLHSTVVSIFPTLFSYSYIYFSLSLSLLMFVRSSKCSFPFSINMWSIHSVDQMV
jgi:hypothetical protein